MMCRTVIHDNLLYCTVSTPPVFRTVVGDNFIFVHVVDGLGLS